MGIDRWSGVGGESGDRQEEGRGKSGDRHGGVGWEWEGRRKTGTDSGVGGGESGIDRGSGVGGESGDRQEEWGGRGREWG